MLLQLNVRYKTRVAMRFTGIPDGIDSLPKASVPRSIARTGG